MTRVFLRDHVGVEKEFLEKIDSRGQIFWREKEACDVEMLSSRFFHEKRVDSGLDSCDSRRIRLGLSPVGSCRLPLKEQGHLTRLEIDASNRGLELIMGDLTRRFRADSSQSITVGAGNIYHQELGDGSWKVRK